VTAIAAIGIHDDLAAGQSGIAHRPAGHELPGRVAVDEVLLAEALRVVEILRQDRLDHMLDQVGLEERLDVEAVAVLRRDEHALDLDGAARAGDGEHFGIVVDSADDVGAQLARLQAAGHAVDVEREETCCYAVQTKVWATDPEGRRWETYFVHAESDARDDADTTCCA